MKHLFKEGHYKDIEGKKVLYLEPSGADAHFNQSYYEITSMLNAYAFGKISSTKYYYIYQKEAEAKFTKEEVRESIEKLLNGDWDNVVNWESLSLGIPEEEYENDIFWDVNNNNIIIVKGKDNLRQLCIDLEWAGYERLGMKKTDEAVEELIINNERTSNIVQYALSNVELTPVFKTKEQEENFAKCARESMRKMLENPEKYNLLNYYKEK